MDQPQNTNPIVAQELISRLTEEIKNLRNENAQLQNRQGSIPRKGKDAGDGAARGYDDLLEEIAQLKDELSQRPSQDEVDELEEKIQKHKGRKREWRRNVYDLHTRLDEAESARGEEERLREELEWEAEKLREDLKRVAEEKEEALARLESRQPDNFDVREFLRGGLGEVPPRPNPRTMTLEEAREIKARRDKFIFPAKEAGAVKWADEGGRFVISLPSVVYNGKTQLTEPFRGDIVTGFLYEIFGAGGRNAHYGSYRCIKRIPMDWDILTSFGGEFVASFLDRVVVQREFAAPAIVSLIHHMYKTGSLKAECLAFQC